MSLLAAIGAPEWSLRKAPTISVALGGIRFALSATTTPAHGTALPTLLSHTKRWRYFTDRTVRSRSPIRIGFFRCEC